MKAAEGERQAAILRAEGNRQAAILEAEGRTFAIASVYTAISTAAPNPMLLAILQLDTLGKFADSSNTKVVVPYESSALMGAAQALKGLLNDIPDGRVDPCHPTSIVAMRMKRRRRLQDRDKEGFLETR